MTGKKIKIALCLSGEPRNSMFCFPYIYESFINLGLEYEIDVYIHTRKTFRAYPLYNCERYMLDHTTPSELLQKTINFSLPSELEVLGDFYLGFTNNNNFVTSQLLMLDGIQKSFQLSLLDHHQYDIYIRCRPDIFTDSSLKIHHIIEDILREKYDMFIPLKDFDPNTPEYNKSQNEYNDQLAIGNFKSTEVYSNTIDNLEYLLNQTKEWKCEYWLKKQLDSYDIKIKNESLPFSLARNVKLQSNRGQNLFDMLYLNP
mgnify:CR=1 FL=1|tara:strand:+ start:948 stop:1721 length:774 start_codon:yes stop_codon:yes gene_type:complete